MAVPMVDDNRFNPQIAALAMPSAASNPLSALGDSLTKWGDKYNANQLFDLTKQKTAKELEAADLGIEKTKQDMDFAEKFNSFRLEEAALENENKKTRNKMLATQAADAEYSLDDKIASKNIYGLLKSLDPKTREELLKDSSGFGYIDPITGKVLRITPAHIQAAKNMIENEELNKARVNAEIEQLNAQSKAALMNAKTNLFELRLRQQELGQRLKEFEAKNGAPTLKLTFINKAAQEAAKTSIAAEAFEKILKNYDDDLIGWLDNGIYSALNKTSYNSKDGTKNEILKQNIAALVGAAKDLVDLKGSDTNAKLQKIEELTPRMNDSENNFKNKLKGLYDFIVTSYRAKLNTYNPTENTPAQYAAWAGNLAALEKLAPQIENLVKDAKQKQGEATNQAKNQTRFIAPSGTPAAARQAKGVNPPAKSNLDYQTYMSLFNK